jgi:hypothetical protein
LTGCPGNFIQKAIGPSAVIDKVLMRMGANGNSLWHRESGTRCPCKIKKFLPHYFWV